MTNAKKPNIDLEAALAELEKLINEMEKGGISLEKSLEYFERGINLTRQCQEVLQAAEQKVQILLNKNGQDELQSYKDEEENEEK